MSTAPSAGLVAALHDIESYAAELGWDQPGLLFALADTEQLRAREPELAGVLDEAELTPVAQETPPGAEMEQIVAQIVWPEDVKGCAVSLERTVLPPQAEADLPDQPELAAEFAAQHPLREEVRVVVGVLRDGSSHCLLRMRAHDDDQLVISGADLVPELVELLLETLRQT